MKPVLCRQEQRPLGVITIEFDESVGSIDLEHILSGIRMLCQYELAEKTGLSSRHFTNVVKIKGIEKGSIIIELIQDLASNVDVEIDIIDVLIGLLECTLQSAKLIAVWKTIKSAICHVLSFSYEKHNEELSIKKEKDGSLSYTYKREEKIIKIGKHK